MRAVQKVATTALKALTNNWMMPSVTSMKPWVRGGQTKKKSTYLTP